jgi:thiamine-monophosphate kinase
MKRGFATPAFVYNEPVTSESDFIASLRALATEPAARDLLDDAAVLSVGDAKLVLTHDMMIEGVHFLPDDPAGDVAWKLVAVNISDLAAKGARPMGILLGYSLGRDEAWNTAFTAGLRDAADHFHVALLGGDTVAMPAGSPIALGLTAIGEAVSVRVPSRAGAREGDILWVTGPIGDKGAGLRIARGEINGPERLAELYRRPEPRPEAGQALAPYVNAMMDLSDGLLIDVGRLAEASGVAAEIDLDCVPLSREYVALCGDGRAERIAAATAGDDYELLFAAAPRQSDTVFTISRSMGLAFTPVGRLQPGRGLSLIDCHGSVPLPPKLGYEHVAGVPA